MPGAGRVLLSFEESLKSAGAQRNAMNLPAANANQAYWDLTAENYDRIFPDSLIGRVQRDAVWRELDKVFQPGMRVLELNCGTGIDAVHLAGRDVRVVACDLSSKMIAAAKQRLSTTGLDERVDFRVLDTAKLERLAVDEPFDGAFSNFSGLNCVRDLSQVAGNLARLLRPGAQTLLCMVGRFSPWEMAWHLAHGSPTLALQRFRRRPTTPMSAPDAVLVHYPSVRDMQQIFAPEFRLRAWRGIGVAVPPSCLETLAQRVPWAVGGLATIDRYISRVPIFRSIGDCVLMQFERMKGESPAGAKTPIS
jgi:ubiquinone/menaquinone biosynthesis C-methylase UbiE